VCQAASVLASAAEGNVWNQGLAVEADGRRVELRLKAGAELLETAA
jgi:hypothetical protein